MGSKLLEFLGRLYTPVVKMVSPVGIHAPCAPTILDVLGTDLYGHTSARLPLFNQLWFEQTFRRVFLQIFKGHEPFALLEFLLVRLRTALDKEWINGCPTLRQVILDYLIIFVFIFLSLYLCGVSFYRLCFLKRCSWQTSRNW